MSDPCVYAVFWGPKFGGQPRDPLELCASKKSAGLEHGYPQEGRLTQLEAGLEILGVVKSHEPPSSMGVSSGALTWNPTQEGS